MVWALWRPRSRLQATVVMAAAVLVIPAAQSLAAQTIEQESDRLPGLPEPSIASSLPRALADPGGVRSRWAARGSPSRQLYRRGARQPHRRGQAGRLL